MNAYLRTLPRTGGHAVTSPVREAGSSALDRRATWPAPDPSTMVLEPSGAPVRSAIETEQCPWPAPDALMRVEHPPPVLRSGAATAALVEPFHPIDMPDIAAAQRAVSSEVSEVSVTGSPAGSPWPPPTLTDAATVVTAPPAPHRNGVGRRLAVGLVAAAGAACAAAAAAVALL